MAETTSGKSRNQTFLEQHERHRLNKLCNRTIDLRGKVPGECQAYQFGGKTHHLDDRAYLLAKQLLERFDGRYTFGVYETLLKALKTLSNSDDAKDKEPDSILSRDRKHVQRIPFDSHLHRKEPRIVFATPVEIRVDDVLYNGATMDITSSAVSIALKRTFALQKGGIVSLSFPELAEKPKLNLLTDIPYKVLVIDHDPLRTRLILTRSRKDNDDVTQQFDLWCQHHNSASYLDLDNELFNLACNYYLHLYCHTLSSPKLWLNPSNFEQPISAFQLTPMAESTLAPLIKDGSLNSSLLPINDIITEQCDLLLFVSSKEVLTTRCDNPSRIAALLEHLIDDDSGNLLLIKTQSINIDVASFEDEIAQIAEKEPDYAANLEKRLNALSLVSSITDITASCAFLPIPPITDDLVPIHTPWQGEAPTPADFNYSASREHQRFLIRTNIHIHINDESLQITTSDLSVSGLSIKIPGNTPLAIGSTILVDFTSWQKQTSDLKLTKLTYTVRNCRAWNGDTHIGLERARISSTTNINKFFISTIERNKSKLVRDNQDTIISQESQIFGSLLGQHLATIPFYLGMDEDNRRIFQAVSSTNNSHPETLWLSLQALVTKVSELLKALPGNTTDSINFGLYCYQDSFGDWQTVTDHDFSSKSQKSLFINRALTIKKHYFFHCQVRPIKSTWFDQETSLNKQLLNLRNHSPHKVRQIKGTLLNLFAVGELTDITDIISTSYTSG